MVFVNQSVEALLTQDRSRTMDGRWLRRVKVKRKMGSRLALVIDVLPKDHLQMALISASLWTQTQPRGSQ